MQFSSDLLPASGYIASLEPEHWASAFFSVIEMHSSRIQAEHRECILSLVERGDFQGTAGLHFDALFPEATFRTAGSINSEVTVRP
jgi:hypothetical protein